jgi:hypothetical protein
LIKTASNKALKKSMLAHKLKRETTLHKQNYALKRSKTIRQLIGKNLLYSKEYATKFKTLYFI